MIKIHKSTKPTGIPTNNLIDIHSHLLPNVDDGSTSFDLSLLILDGLKAVGFRDVIVTPHYVPGTKYTSSVEANQKIFRELKAAWMYHESSRDEYTNILHGLGAAGGKLRLYLGNEIYIDRDIAKLLKKHEIAPLADSKYLLVELPMSGEFDGYEDILDSLRYDGYQVILAHPERYSSTHHDFSILKKLSDDGVLFQCNYGSFIGQYGKNSLKTAEKLAKNKMIFTISTDTHRTRNEEDIIRSLQKLRKFYSDAEIEDLTYNNPHKILDKN